MKAVIYARVSSAGDRQSTTRQVADLTKYAKFDSFKQDWTVTILFSPTCVFFKNTHNLIFFEFGIFCEVSHLTGG